MTDSFSIDVEPVYVPGQYGLNYSATRGGDGSNSLEISEWVGSSEGGPPITVFIKSPDLNANTTEREDFLKEFESGQAVNSAASHLENTAGDARPPETPFQFAIPRMIGRGRLTLREQDPVDCLIYEHAKVMTMLHELIFPDKEDDDVSGPFLAFAYNLARAVQVLHNQGVVHSFLVPRNILGDRRFDFAGRFNVVGFGYARLCDAQGKVPDGLKITDEDNVFRAPETRKQETYKAYWLQADIYSIGALLHYLLLRLGGQGDRQARQALQRLPIDVRRLKDKIATDLNEIVPRTVRGNENILKLIDSCLRNDHDQRFSCVEELLDAIDIASTASRSSPVDTRPPDRNWESCNSELALAKRISRLTIRDRTTDRSQPYFEHLRGTLATELAQKFGSLERGHLEIYGSRDRIIPSLCRLLGSAEAKDMYDTLTLPDYWTDENLGSTGRFLTMNKHMVRRGVDIRRVFLVSKTFHELTETEQVILDAQLAAWVEIETERKNRDINTSSYGKFEIYVHRVEEEQIAEFENVGSTVAYLSRRQEPSKFGGAPAHDITDIEAVCLNFFSTARARWSKGRVFVTRSIKKVRYWIPGVEDHRFRTNVERFNDHIANGESLMTYARGDYRGDMKSIRLESLLQRPEQPQQQRT